jgi:hypothetical protein
MKKTDKQKLFEAFEKVCKIKLIKEEKSPRESLKDVLIDIIDLDAEGDEKILEMFKIFKEQKGYEIKRVGISNALKDWFMGVPSVVGNLPYNYYDLNNLLYAIGYFKNQDVEDEEVSETFFDELVKIVLDTVKKYQ